MRRFWAIPAHVLLGFVAVFLVLVMMPPAAHGQSQFGQITGLVTDSAGNSIVGASVVVTNESTGISINSETNSAGNYSMGSLVPGTYRITVTKSGFGPTTRNGIVLQIAQTAEINFALQVGQVHQQVTVSASGGLLQTQNAVIGTVVPQSGVVNLPLNGRNYLQLATLVPGVNSAGLGKLFFNMPTNNLNINGQRISGTTYMIDGANVMMQFTSGTPYTPAPDAIQEFRVETNSMTAEFEGGGSVVNVALKSGTNSFHGDIYEFLRNDALDAKNYFALTTPELRFNQFGATLGGPVWKSKLFFFGDYQGNRIVQGATDNSVVPTAAEKQGNFAGLPPIHDPFTGQPLPGNQIPTADIAPQAAFFLQFYPEPNTPAGTYVRNANGTNSVNQYDLRFDAHIRNSDLLTYTWSQFFNSNAAGGPLPLNGGTSGPSQGEFTNVNWTHTFSPNIVNQANFSYARVTASTTGQGIGTNYTVQSGIGGFQQTTIDYPGFPNLSISGFRGINGYEFLPLGQVYNHYDFSDVLTDVIGRHTLTLGGNARWTAEFNFNGAYSRGVFSFNGDYTGNPLADFLYGVPFSGRRGFPRNLFGFYQRIQGVFFQDSWKATPNLTILGGVRWNIIHSPTALHNTAASVDLANNKIIVASDSKGNINTTAQQVTSIILPLFQSMIVPSSKVGLPPSLIHMNWRDFAPRIGIAYQAPSWNGVIRAGYGIFYPLLEGNTAVSSAIVNPPFIADQPIQNTAPVPSLTLATMFPEPTPGHFTLPPLGFDTIDPHRPDQYVQEWNLAIQKNFHGIVSAQVAYVGSKNTHANFENQANIPLPGPGNIQGRRPNTFFSAGALLNAAGFSNYNSLQATVQTLSWHGLFALGSFTWAKAMDNQSGDQNAGSSVQDPNNIGAEYGVADFNLARRFTLGLTYNLPVLQNRALLTREALGGWSLSSVVTVQTGPAVTASLGSDPANTGTPMRPNQSHNANLGSPTIHHWFDTTAFSVPAPFTYGNAQRNTITGPPLRDWDFGLHKSFALSHLGGEEQRLQLRGEVFNLTNTPPFGVPDAGLGDRTFGQVLSAGNPRIIQVAAKIIF